MISNSVIFLPIALFLSAVFVVSAWGINAKTKKAENPQVYSLADRAAKAVTFRAAKIACTAAKGAANAVLSYHKDSSSYFDVKYNYQFPTADPATNVLP